MHSSLLSTLYSRLCGLAGRHRPPAQSRNGLSFPRTPSGQFAAALLVLAAIAYCFFSPIFHGYTLSDIASHRNELYPWAYQPAEQPRATNNDQVLTLYPWQVFVQSSIRAGDFPLWDPYSFAGHPFFANGQNMLLYPPRLLFSFISTPSKAHDLLLFSHMLMGGMTMFLLLSNTRLSFAASLFGGVAWMLNGFMLAWMVVEHTAAIQAWLPLAFLLMRGTVKRRSCQRGVGVGIVMALIYFGGNILFVEFTFAVIACYAVYLLFRAWRRESRSPSSLGLRRVVVAGCAVTMAAIVATGLIAIQLIPAWELVRAMDRSGLTYAELRDWQPSIFEIISSIMLRWPKIDTYNSWLFLGTPSAILALVGFWRRHSLVAYSRTVAIVVLLVATGTPLVWIFYKIIPGVSHITLGRLLFLYDFSVAVLAAFGLDWVLRRGLALTHIRLTGHWRSVWVWVITTALIGIVIVQMYPLAAWFTRCEVDRSDSLLPATPLTDALSSRERVRILPIHPELHGSTAMIFKLQSVGGYDSIVPDRIGKLWRAVQESASGGVFDQVPVGALETYFTIDSAFDLAPRLGVTDLVVPPLAPTSGGKWNLPDNEVLTEMHLHGDNLVPLIGDWDGDELDSTGLFDLQSHNLYLWNSESGDDGAPQVTVKYDMAGKSWVPLAGDWNGDYVDTLGLYDPSTSVFHLYNLNSSGQDNWNIKYGEKDWIPLAGDWDGDGVDTIGAYDPTESIFHLKGVLKADPNSETSFQFGSPNKRWIPIAGDWNGDKVDSIGLYDPQESVFCLKNENSEGKPDITVPYKLKDPYLKPISGYWHKAIGRRRFDIVALFDPSNVEFYIGVPAFLCEIKPDLVYTGADGDIYKIRDPVPRAYIVPVAEVVDSPAAALLRFTDLGFDPRESVIVESEEIEKAGIKYQRESEVIITQDTPPAVNQISSGDGEGRKAGGAEIINRSLNTLTVQVDSLRGGWLVVAESWDPGWAAKLDGSPTPVLAGNYAFRTMRVPAGRHTVELVYRPVGFVLGATISGTTLGLLLIVVGVWTIKRRREIHSA